MTDEELATLVAERDAARMELARTKVGAATGLTPEQAARLRGTTVDELTADATALLAEFAAVPATAVPATAVPTPARPVTAAGSDVGSTLTDTDAGEARYRAQNGIGEDGTRTERYMPRSTMASGW
jgi:hypothetical protein